MEFTKLLLSELMGAMVPALYGPSADDKRF
jgi:hypothetical protein